MTEPHERKVSRSRAASGAQSKLHPVDVKVGLALAERRKQLGVSQLDLALDLGVTYQQLQKYETGKNRISASRLWDASIALGCDVNYFFGQADEDDRLEAAAPAFRAFLKAIYGNDLAHRFAALSPEMQARVVALLAPLARALTVGGP